MDKANGIVQSERKGELPNTHLGIVMQEWKDQKGNFMSLPIGSIDVVVERAVGIESLRGIHA